MCHTAHLPHRASHPRATCDVPAQPASSLRSNHQVSAADDAGGVRAQRACSSAFARRTRTIQA